MLKVPINPTLSLLPPKYGPKSCTPTEKPANKPLPRFGQISPNSAIRANCPKVPYAVMFISPLNVENYPNPPLSRIAPTKATNVASGQIWLNFAEFCG